VKIALLVLGVALVLYGLHWIGQGTGLLMWPAGTVMDNNRTFAWLGAAVILAGAGTLAFARRR
jgi:LPXTG-motif cell wall-anchored protein